MLLATLMLIVISMPTRTLFSRILNTTPIVLLGLWSYSIYLWQQIWLYKDWEISLSVRWIGMMVSALLSYYLIEKQFLLWRDKVLVKKQKIKVIT